LVEIILRSSQQVRRLPVKEINVGSSPTSGANCKFGTGQQVMCECRMIYIHIFGYYPTRELYKEALKTLCPNYKNEKL
jgi:hypothetical protein